jgi:putative FmdB family regulatory protein
MPIYTYLCKKCGKEVEQVVSYEKRDSDWKHEDCGGSLKWSGIELFCPGKESYQMKAITESGEHVSGHFGKTARTGRSGKGKGWSRP